MEVRVPDIGNFAEVDVIEILVKEGDVVQAEDSLVSLESDKATMDIPAPFSGTVKAIRIKVGDKAAEGTLILTMEASAGASPVAVAEKPAAPVAPVAAPVAPVAEIKPVPQAASTAPAQAVVVSSKTVHASPSVRAFARELGVDLTQVNGSGPKRRLLKEDVQAYVKAELSKPRGAGAAGGLNFGLPSLPAVDFTKFGEIEVKALSRIKKLSGANLHRNWVASPHVTQFEEVDITDLEAFRKGMQDEAAKQGVKLTLLPFLMKAVLAGLKTYPEFNASLSEDGESLVLKKYFHIGFAADTPDGLVVPVIRNADQKGIIDISRELGVLSGKAREKKISPADMQGGCFTISSLGGIGGTYFTPILNSPEVAILGVSRASMKPVWNGKEFVPRLMLPLSLSYDHRVIDGALGARMTSFLSAVLSDMRRLLL
ncbi:MAG: dihydrolipoyllysine-residue acetyltransferase [Sulfuricellaceae bacterium]|nr:dihydrolipoyllysine-residue acetyltransferase [Sulfuricellaceae bacterium]